MAVEHIEFKGLPAVRLALPDGDAVVASLHGGQVLSWQCGGQEQLFLSDKQVFGGGAALRGGVPVCFPQFNQRGPLPKHGIARRLSWQLEGHGEDEFVLLLRDGAASRELWPERFELRLTVGLAARELQLHLAAHNTGSAPWSFTTALHTYLRVQDITQTRLAGVQGLACWDALLDKRFVEDESALHFGQVAGAAFDRVFVVGSDGLSPRQLELQQAHPAGHVQRLQITQSETLTEAVVWNPGQAGSAQLADMPDDGWRHMLCVEAARIDQPVTLAPGETWMGHQTLTVLAD